MIQTLAAQLRTVWVLADLCIFGSLCRKRTMFVVGNVDSRDVHRIGRKCVGTGGRCSVSGQKHVHPKASASRPEFCSSWVHTRTSRLSLALAMILTMNARRFQRTTLLCGVGSSVYPSKDIGTEVTDLAFFVNQNQ